MEDEVAALVSDPLVFPQYRLFLTMRAGHRQRFWNVQGWLYVPICFSSFHPMLIVPSLVAGMPPVQAYHCCPILTIPAPPQATMLLVPFSRKRMTCLFLPQNAILTTVFS